MTILKSASKIVLLLFSLTLCIGIMIGKLEANIFESAIMVVLTYYFTKESVKTGQIK